MADGVVTAQLACLCCPGPPRGSASPMLWVSGASTRSRPPASRPWPPPPPRPAPQCHLPSLDSLTWTLATPAAPPCSTTSTLGAGLGGWGELLGSPWDGGQGTSGTWEGRWRPPPSLTKASARSPPLQAGPGVSVCHRGPQRHRQVDAARPHFRGAAAHQGPRVPQPQGAWEMGGRAVEVGGSWRAAGRGFRARKGRAAGDAACSQALRPNRPQQAAAPRPRPAANPHPPACPNPHCNARRCGWRCSASTTWMGWTWPSRRCSTWARPSPRWGPPCFFYPAFPICWTGQGAGGWGGAVSCPLPLVIAWPQHQPKLRRLGVVC